VPTDCVIHILIDKDAERDLKPARAFMGLLAHNGYRRSVLVTKKHAESHVKSEEDVTPPARGNPLAAPSSRRASPIGKPKIRYKGAND